MGKYNTKQQTLISRFLEKNANCVFTADEIYERLKADRVSVGKTTVYRRLEQLCENGDVRKYTTHNEKSASYQFIHVSCREHYHLKCAKCGKLIHIDCGEIEHLQKHFKNDHGFVIDMSKTVFYGCCQNCM